jgi:peroxiredoxin
MNPTNRPMDIPPPSTVPVQGWHCSHFFYRWNRDRIAGLSDLDRRSARQEIRRLLDPSDADRPQRFQRAAVVGHKADLALVMMDPDPLRINAIHQRLMQCRFGELLQPTYSFVSMSEISEYLPDKEQYAKRLIHSGEDAHSATFQAKVASYEKRLPMMLAQRLAPEFPDWPALCFYPMNKVRNVGANWFALPFSERQELMSEHAQSGMAFAGRVTQLVTASVGLDDWEWGVTLWARNPQYLKEIVYTMRYDRASARYGQFGPFYTAYPMSADGVLEHTWRM